MDDMEFTDFTEESQGRLEETDMDREEQLDEETPQLEEEVLQLDEEAPQLEAEEDLLVSQTADIMDEENPALLEEEEVLPEEEEVQEPTGIFEPVTAAGKVLVPLTGEEEEPSQELAPQTPPKKEKKQKEKKPPKPKKLRKPMNPKVRTALKVAKWVLFILLTIVLIVGFALGYLTITEYNPAHSENATRGVVTVEKKFSGDTFKIMTLNTGYGGLGRDADFFMDGGESVNPDSRETVVQNMLGVEDIVRSVGADFVLLQEVDTDSKRSFEINQWRQYEYDFEDYESRYALNYSCQYVPYPLPTIGKVNSGLATFSRYDIASASRQSLPCPFSWPMRVANLKRCLLITRIPIEGKTQEIVIVNLHLEAYDDGEGKAAQTKALMELLTAEYEKGNYVIAGGDFNQSFPGALSRYPIKDSSTWAPGTLEALPEGWHYGYDDSDPTCRLLNEPYVKGSEKVQHYVIDGFILSPNVEILSVDTRNEYFTFTDHNPVILEVILK